MPYRRKKLAFAISSPDDFLLNNVARIARSLKMNLLKSELRYSEPFWNANAMNENESADFAHFNPKIGCHGNALRAIGKRRSDRSSNAYHVV